MRIIYSPDRSPHLGIVVKYSIFYEARAHILNSHMVDWLTLQIVSAQGFTLGGAVC